MSPSCQSGHTDHCDLDREPSSTCQPELRTPERVYWGADSEVFAQARAQPDFLCYRRRQT